MHLYRVFHYKNLKNLFTPSSFYHTYCNLLHSEFEYSYLLLLLLELLLLLRSVALRV